MSRGLEPSYAAMSRNNKLLKLASGASGIASVLPNDFPQRLRKQAQTQGECSKCRHHQPWTCTCPDGAANGDNIDQVQFPQLWNELRHNRQLCDGAILCADGKRIQVNRAILSATSPYFKALFTNILHNGHPEPTEVSLTDVSAELLQPILDFAYTGQCNVTSHNVESLLPLADRLGVVGAVQQCCCFLLRKMCPENCLGIFRFARQYFCHELEASSHRYILQYFHKILKESSELCDLTVDELHLLLSDDELNARSEELVFEAVRRWIERDLPGRRKYLSALLPCIRIGVMPAGFLVTVFMYGPIHDDKSLHNLLLPANIIFPEFKQDQDLDPSNTFERPRAPFEIIFTVGGWDDGKYINVVETYDCRANRWCLSPFTCSKSRAYHGLVQLDGLIYMVGGRDDEEHCNTLFSFNPVTKEWKELACMYQVRCYVSACSLGGEIYAMGGYDGRIRLSTAETYNPRENQWNIIPSMNKARSDASAASLDGKVFVAGGFNGEMVLNSVEFFDPATSQWTLIPNMQNARSGVSLVAHHGHIYALGGYDGVGIDRLCSGERFEPGARKWQPIPDMFRPRSNFAAVVLENNIYVIGGYEGCHGEALSDTEYFDVDENQWRKAQKMIQERSALAAVVIVRPPTA